MNPPERLAIIGSGASAIYLLKHLLDHVEILKPQVALITIFERSSILGMGMPYNPQTTDRYNMSNISSEELPELPETLGNWLRAQDPAFLTTLGVDDAKEDISDTEVYSRLALGQYLQAQYRTLIACLEKAGIAVQECSGCEIVDLIQKSLGDKGVTLVTKDDTRHDYNRVIIATGHSWPKKDKPEAGYYASPWPISKILPKDGNLHDFAIGTLGASLSAFDVIDSLAHRHGEFVTEPSGKMTYQPYPGTERFKIVMHSSEGLLPHLQFDQDCPFREIYRHAERDTLLGLRDSHGFLRIATYFDKVCRPALIKALEKDYIPEMVSHLEDPAFGLLDFVEKMGDKHDYPNAFEGMRKEMVEAKESVEQHKPIHWKEVIDDLMYTLNFHADLMPAEDHLTLQTKVMPFLLNVVAAMPLPSGNTILALYDAGKLEMVAGRAKLAEKQDQPDQTTIVVQSSGHGKDKNEEDKKETILSYRMFIDCTGQKPLELEDYPFPSLVKNGLVRKARAPFAKADDAEDLVPDDKKDHLLHDQVKGIWTYHTGGTDIDGTYRLIARNGQPNPRIHDIAFPHTFGVRPYSYGLQACNHTAAILVEAWVKELQAKAPVENKPEEITEIYEEVQASS